MSGTRYSSGQNMLDGDDEVGVEGGSWACDISGAGDLACSRRKKDRIWRLLDFLVASLPILLGFIFPSHVRRGWPRKPWMNMMLDDVSNFVKCMDAIVLHAKLVIILRAWCQPREVESVHGSAGWCHRSWAGRLA